MTKKESLRNKTRKGVFWSAFNTFFKQGLTFLFGIVLARLLLPSDYGTIGILMVFIHIIAIFIDSGFSVALIRKEEKKPEDYDTQFYFNIIVGFVCYFILFLGAPLIAHIYNDPILCPTMRVLAITLIIQSFGIVQSAIYSINLNFKSPAIVAVSANLCSGSIGIFLAYEGLGVWALVVQHILSKLITVSVYWYLSKWRPSKRFSRESFNYLFGFGSKILGSSIIQTIYNNIYPLLIGNRFGSSNLGLYSRANHFAQLPSVYIAQILNSVSFPVLSSVNTEKNKVLSVYFKIYRISVFVVFPLMICLAAVAQPLVLLLIGVKWESCIVMLQLLCFALMLQPVSVVNQSIIKVVNRPDLILKLEFIKRPIGICIIIGSLFFGMIGVCIGTILIYLVAFIADNICASIALGISKREQIKVFLPILINSLMIGFFVFFSISFFENYIIQLIVATIIGVVLLLFTSKIFFKDTFEDIIQLVKGKFNKTEK